MFHLYDDRHLYGCVKILLSYLTKILTFMPFDTIAYWPCVLFWQLTQAFSARMNPAKAVWTRSSVSFIAFLFMLSYMNKF